jgi:hypothetical protein
LKVKRLKLHHNQITQLGNTLRNLRHLEQIDISYNAISDIGELGKCDNLRQINLNGNRISSLSAVDQLQPLGILESLSLSENPITEDDHYRLRVIFRIQGLRTLDNVTVSAADRVKSRNLYGADVSSRETTHKAHLIEESFVNHLPIYTDPMSSTASSPRDEGVVAKELADSIVRSSILQASNKIS